MASTTAGRTILPDDALAADSAPVSLAVEKPVRIGPLLFEPARRSITHDDGRAATLEPRAAKVLVALLRAPGAVFSRDDLFEACWEGRAVSDDAVDQAVARLRRAVQPVADGIIQLETVTKVGHRLVLELPEGAQRSAAAPPVARPRIPRAPLIAAAAIAVLMLAIAGFAMLRSAMPTAPRVAIIAPHGDGAEALARSLSADLARLAGARPAALTVTEDWEEADYLFRVSREQAGGRVRADLNLISRQNPELIWSASVEQSDGDGDQLRARVAGRLGALVLCALVRPAQAARLDPFAQRLFFAACDQAEEPADEGQLTTLRQLVERAPDFAPGLARLALAEARLGFANYDVAYPDNDAKRALRASAQEHLLRAREIDPELDTTYFAELELLRGGQWEERLAIIERGLAVTPDSAALIAGRASVLGKVGRNEQAVSSARRAVELDPLSAGARENLVSTLAYSGRAVEARRELEAAERIWPGSLILGESRARFELRYGDPERALEAWGRYHALGLPVEQSREVMRVVLRAQRDPTPANVDAALAIMKRRRHPLYISALGQFGRNDAFYEVVFERLQRPGVRDALRDFSDTFFRDYMHPIRRDRRFMDLAARLGLIDFWERTGLWPDFCGTGDLPYNCREEARRLRGG